MSVSCQLSMVLGCLGWIFKGRALHLVRHNCFEVLVMVSLVASSVTLGLETHINMQDINQAAGTSKQFHPLSPIFFRAFYRLILAYIIGSSLNAGL